MADTWDDIFGDQAPEVEEEIGAAQARLVDAWRRRDAADLARFRAELELGPGYTDPAGQQRHWILYPPKKLLAALVNKSPGSKFGAFTLAAKVCAALGYARQAAARHPAVVAEPPAADALADFELDGLHRARHGRWRRQLRRRRRGRRRGRREGRQGWRRGRRWRGRWVGRQRWQRGWRRRRQLGRWR